MSGHGTFHSPDKAGSTATQRPPTGVAAHLLPSRSTRSCVRGHVCAEEPPSDRGALGGSESPVSRSMTKPGPSSSLFSGPLSPGADGRSGSLSSSSSSAAAEAYHGCQDGHLQWWFVSHHKVRSRAETSRTVHAAAIIATHLTMAGCRSWHPASTAWRHLPVSQLSTTVCNRRDSWILKDTNEHAGNPQQGTRTNGVIVEDALLNGGHAGGVGAATCGAAQKAAFTPRGCAPAAPPAQRPGTSAESKLNIVSVCVRCEPPCQMLMELRRSTMPPFRNRLSFRPPPVGHPAPPCNHQGVAYM